MMDRVILHADCNSFYVSCEMHQRPELRGKAVVVGGDPELRHGIVLAKSEIAKKNGVKTGMALWQAAQTCPNLIILPPRHKLYARYTDATRNVFRHFTDQVEPFGLDEAWLDVTHSQRLFGDGVAIAEKIRSRIKNEIGITVSVGVSWNKAYAKLGSDMKKPDAVTVLTRDNYRDKVWRLPVSDLLYVGRATAKKLFNLNILSIGDLANAQLDLLRQLLGKNGEMLWAYANGLDTSEVGKYGDHSAVKSIGNSTTTPRDLTTIDDVRLTMYVLSESVAARMREHGYRGQVVEIYVRDNKLQSLIRQHKIPKPTQLADEIFSAAVELFEQNYNLDRMPPVRSIGVRVTMLTSTYDHMQLSFLPDEERRVKIEALEHAIDGIRRRYGYFSILRGVMLADRQLSDFNPRTDNIDSFNGTNAI